MTDRLNERVIRDLGKYRITLKMIPTSSHTNMEAYIVREGSQNNEVSRYKKYDYAFTQATQLQEEKIADTPPENYERTFVLKVGNLSIFRTVALDKRTLTWLYIAVDPKGDTVYESPRFKDVTIAAINHEIEFINQAKAEADGS